MRENKDFLDGLDRRAFLKGAAAIAALGPSLMSCGSTIPTRVQGFKGLADLPYFELDADGKLRLTEKNVPGAIDVHSHLGIAVLMAPKIDLLAKTPKTHYWFDFDNVDPVAPLDLNIYVNKNATPAVLERMETEFRKTLTSGSEVGKTHTIPNLLDDMDRTGVAKSWILSLAPQLTKNEDLTREWYEGIQKAGAQDRLVLWGAVHPRDKNAEKKLRLQKRKYGIRGVKLHPSVQSFYPNDTAAMKIYALCEELDLPVIWNSGRASVGPKDSWKYSAMKGYIEPLKSFPKMRFIFGHSGNRDWKEALEIAAENKNVWCDTHGLGIPAMEEFIDRLGPERIFFGSDWPFYHIAASMAKALHVTRGDQKVRTLLLRDNAENFLNG